MKFERVLALRAAAGRGKVLLVDDGTSGALAPLQADISIALGSETNLALSTVAVVFLDVDGSALRVLRGVSCAAVPRIRVNFVWLAYIVCLQLLLPVLF
jgi:cation transport ATPase